MRLAACASLSSNADEGLFGEIPKILESYIDFDAIVVDLAADYAEKVIGEKNFVFRIA